VKTETIFGAVLGHCASIIVSEKQAVVAECRGFAARDRVLTRMVVALEQEIRVRQWEETGLSGPMLRAGIYADFHELINQSAQDDAWIKGFDQKWQAKADAAEKQAKAAAGLDVQVIPNAAAFETLVKRLNSKQCQWDMETAELAGAHARVVKRPPTPTNRKPPTTFEFNINPRL
jgi:hypothetical protein